MASKASFHVVLDFTKMKALGIAPYFSVDEILKSNVLNLLYLSLFIVTMKQTLFSLMRHIYEQNFNIEMFLFCKIVVLFSKTAYANSDRLILP